MKIGEKDFDFENKTYVMGILNVTPDSFSDGGEYNSIEVAIKRAKQMVLEGADIIDIGGESSRPGADYVDVKEELKRILPIVEKLVEVLDIPISIDTYKAEVARECLIKGAHIINDISGLKADGKMKNVIKEFNVPCILMHMRGNPKTMQSQLDYVDFMKELKIELSESLEIATKVGIEKNKIILDPGIGFSKSFNQNLEVINKLEEIIEMNYPILVGASRKRFIGEILNAKSNERLEGSLAIASISTMKGASIIRVHDVAETKKTVQVIEAIKKMEIEV